MATDHSAVVCPPSEDGGRRVRIGSRFVGIAHSITDVVAFMQQVGLRGWDETDVDRTELIEWRGGGPDAWR
ncbi:MULTISPECIES: hypothetical protein [Streptomyces]|jgi:hypothetical protein|uniref:hypothetical protein n=1 Tax=Streptomyces TaxID=1883 RepID=UPI000A373850|nr:hypothetical protein [Streptomyces glaucescens]